MVEKLKEKAEELLNVYIEEGLNMENIDLVMKLTDIHKDMSNEEYWKEKIDMMFRNYSEGGSYGRRKDSRGRYMEGSSYGRRGVPGTGRGRYRGEDDIEDMKYHYGNYSEGRTYGNDEESEKSFDKMIECLEDFVYTIMEEADEPQKVEKIKRVAKRISDM